MAGNMLLSCLHQDSKPRSVNWVRFIYTMAGHIYKSKNYSDQLQNFNKRKGFDNLIIFEAMNKLNDTCIYFPMNFLR
jgi:hypothetical protein